MAAALAPAAALAQPDAQETPAQGADLERKRQQFAWLIGTWESHFEGDTLFAQNRSGAVLEFYLETNGTVSATIRETNAFMEDYGYRKGTVVFRGISTSGSSAISNHMLWADGGQFYKLDPSQNVAEWDLDDGGVIVHREGPYMLPPPTVNGYLSDHAKWYKTTGTPLPGGSQIPAGVQEKAEPAPAEAPAGGPAPAKIAAGTPDQTRADCDWNVYFQHLRDNGEALVARFERNTLRLVEQDDDNVIDKKLFPYGPDVRASYVSFDENATIEGWERLAGQMIANQGADDWLKKTRLEIASAFRTANLYYWRSARAQEKCPGMREDRAAYAELLSAYAVGVSVAIRKESYLSEQLEAAYRLREAYTRKLFEELASTGSIKQKLIDAGKDQLDAILTGQGVPIGKIDSLSGELDRLSEKFARMEARGVDPSQEQILRETEQAFKQAGIDYRPSGKSLWGNVASGSKDALFAGLTYVAAKFTDLGKVGVLTRNSYLYSLIDHIEIAKGLADTGRLNVVWTQILPSTNAVREDVAHLEVLIRRYELVQAEYDALSSGYSRMFAEAEVAARPK